MCEGGYPLYPRKTHSERNEKMEYEIVEGYTPEIEDKDYVVFLKTDFQTPVLNEKGKVVRWTQDADNYIYAIFPNRKGSGMMVDSYVKPQGDILTWKDKLRKTGTMEYDALSEDLPATWDEFSDLLTKLVIDHTVGDGCIVIEDATTWQKLRAARKRLLRKQMDEVMDGGGVKATADTPVCDPYPLAFAM